MTLGIFLYGNLVVIGTAASLLAYAARKDGASFALGTALTLSLLTVGEYFVLTVFGGYWYYPGLREDPFADSVFGYFLGNWLLWPGAANLVVSYNLGPRPMLLMAAAFILIEALFLHLGVFEHRWWRLYMTGGAALLLLLTVKTWVWALQASPSPSLLHLTLLLVSVLFFHVPTHTLLFAGQQHYSPGWVDNLYRDSILFGFAYHALLSLVYVFFTSTRRPPLALLASFLFIMLGDCLLLASSVLVFTGGWTIYRQMLFRTACLLGLLLFGKYTLRHMSPASRPGGP